MSGCWNWFWVLAARETQPKEFPREQLKQKLPRPRNTRNKDGAESPLLWKPEIVVRKRSCRREPTDCPCRWSIYPRARLHSLLGETNSPQPRLSKPARSVGELSW